MDDSQEIISKPMLNPFGAAQQVPTYKAAKPRWINISGDGKLGKTFTMVELAKQLRTLYFDVDPLLSTTAYEGHFIRCNDWRESDIAFNKYKNLCKTSQVKPTICVIDTLDGLSDYALEHVIKMAGTNDLLKASIKMSDGTTGNGFTLLHQLMIQKISDAQQMCDLLITITHPKVSALGKEEKIKQVKTLNLIGSFKYFVQQACDANLWFVKRTDARGKEFVAIQTDAGDEISFGEGFGARPFKGLREANTTEKFIDYIASTFGNPTQGAISTTI